MKLTVSLIVHNDFSHIRAALHSLRRTRTPFQAYITINTGYVPEVDQLRKEFPEVVFHINESPRGFAANHNAIMRMATSEFVGLLNDDIILHNGALDTLVAYLDNHPETGLVGPKLFNADGTPQVSYYSDPGLLRMIYKISGLAIITHQQSPVRRWLQRLRINRLLNVESLNPHPNTARPVPVIKGTVMVVRRKAYQQVGLMDETTLAYGEEIDWHWRLRQAGWQVVFVPEAQVTHFGTSQATLRLTGKQLVEDRKAILNYYLKFRPFWQVMMIRCSIALSHSFWGLISLPLSRQQAQAHFRTAHLGITWQREHG